MKEMGLTHVLCLQDAREAWVLSFFVTRVYLEHRAGLQLCSDVQILCQTEIPRPLRLQSHRDP